MEEEAGTRRMRNGKERKTSPLDCDIGLGLQMQLQPTESYSCDGGGPHYSNPNNYQFVSDIYHTALSRSSQNTTFRASVGRSMGVSGKALFTESQWQELERQNMIHKYILASVPVPPQLLLPTSPALSFLSQYNTSGLDMRIQSTGSDPEPWRCKRTDGKKWRCSRDVAPDQKYCERHAHKSKLRSRKHVEISSHTNNYSSHIPTMPSSTTTPYDQSRCMEWFARGDTTTTTPTSSKQQQLMQIPSRFEGKTNCNKNVSKQAQNYKDKQVFYIPDTSNLQMPETHNSETISSHRIQTTRHFFIDAWDNDDGLASSLSKKLSPSSLSLSMSGGGNNIGIVEEDMDENGFLGIGMSNAAVSWMNNSISPPAPGGPLGEALCVGGNASGTRGGLSLASPPGYSNTNSSSSCSKSSCGEDGSSSHALNFIG